MAEDAAQEERQRHLRHAVAVRHRRLGDRARHHRELPDPHPAAERTRDRAADHRHLSPLRPQRPPDRDPRAGDAQARLLLPVAARQPAVRAGPVRRGAGALRRLVEAPTRPLIADVTPNTAATASSPSGCANAARPGPPTSSPTSPTSSPKPIRRHAHDPLRSIPLARLRIAAALLAAPLALSSRCWHARAARNGSSSTRPTMRRTS
jgi:hypothetical protein